MAEINHLVGIRTPAGRIFTALSTIEGLARWWTVDVKGSAALGGTIQFRFAEQGGPDMLVTELAKGVGAGSQGSAWPLSKLGQFALAHLPLGTQLKHSDAERLASAPLVALLTTRQDRRIDQMQAGQAFMRIALKAEAQDIRVQPVSQVLEVADARAEVARIFALGDRTAQHMFRLGHADKEVRPYPRRPLSEMTVVPP